MQKMVYTLSVLLITYAAAYAQNSCFAPFADFKTYYGQYASSSIAAADMNNDGDEDVIVNMADILILNGNGDGSFDAPVSYSSNGQSSGKMCIADFNSDNKPDIISFDNPPSGTKSLSIYTNNNYSGVSQVLTLTTTIQAGNAQSPGAIEVADVDGDNLKDVVVNDYDGYKIYVYKNNGNNTLTQLAMLTTTYKPLNIAVGDLNADNRADIVCNYNDLSYDSVSVFINNGSGGFSALATIAGGAGYGGIAIADIDGDGKNDLVNSYAAYVRFIKGNGNGTFAAGYSNGYIAATANKIMVGDWNNDTKRDVAFLNSQGYIVGSALGNGNGTFATSYNGSSYGSAGDAVVADFDSDGNEDVVTVNGAQGNISFLKGQADGSFGPLSLRAGNEPERFVIGLVNSDTIPDIVTADYRSNTISIMIGNGNGSFQPSIQDTSGNGIHDLALAHFNNDGKTDIAMANNGNVSIALGNGDGTFTTPVLQSLPGAGGDWAIAAGDLNNDTYSDVVATSANLDSVFVLIGNGNGTFVQGVGYATGDRPFDVKLALLNNDTYPDIVVPNDISNNVSVLYGTGTGTFQQAVNLACGAGPRTVAVADFNNDTYPDIVTANNNADNVTVILNNGNGSFAAAAAYPVTTSSSISTVATGYFNNDSFPDLIVSQYLKNNVAVLLNNGNGTFGSLSTYATDYRPNDAAFFDFNYDGFTDIASCNTAGSVTVILNSGVTLSAAGSTQLCSGDSVLLVATGGTSYLWSNGATTASVYVSAADNYTCTVTVQTSTGNCIAQPAAIPVTVASGPPSVSFNSVTNRFCVTDNPVNLSLVGGSPQGGVYSGNFVSNGVFDVTASGVGQHVVAYSISNNCGTSIASDTFYVDAEVLASINLPSDTFCDNQGAITLAPYGSPAGGVWGVNNQVVTTVNPSLAGPGTYLLHYTIIAGGCRDTAYVNAVVENCTGINEATDGAIYIYPNPSSGKFIVYIENDQKFLKGSLYTMQGALVATQNVDGLSSVNFNTSLNAGVYILQLSALNGNTVRRVVIY